MVEGEKLGQKREWVKIEICYDDGVHVVLYRNDLEKIEELTPIIEALQRAKSLKEQLDNLLK
jgi:hypothetical protein